MDIKKICSKCREEKPLSDFYRNVSGTHGVRGDCRACKAIYHVENQKKIKATRAAHYAANASQLNAISRAYYAANIDKASASNASYYAKNKSERQAYNKAWQAANPENLRANCSRRRSAKLNANPAWDAELTDLVAIEAADLCVKREAATGFEWHVDHMIPLQARTACGLHTWANLQVIPQSLNLKKHNKMRLTEPMEWLQHV